MTLLHKIRHLWQRHVVADDPAETARDIEMYARAAHRGSPVSVPSRIADAVISRISELAAERAEAAAASAAVAESPCPVWLLTRDAARAHGVSASTVRTWIQRGHVAARWADDALTRRPVHEVRVDERFAARVARLSA